MPGKHGPNRLANYLQVHNAVMTSLLDAGFVVEDTCAFTYLPRVILLEGSIRCLDAISLDVTKEISVLKDRGMNARVQTTRFRYHAWVRGVHNILRYDSAHGHRPYAHKHVYDTFGTGREVGIIQLEDEDDVPTLGDVIRELQRWHVDNAVRIRTLR